jgi:hypothetical protein
MSQEAQPEAKGEIEQLREENASLKIKLSIARALLNQTAHICIWCVCPKEAKEMGDIMICHNQKLPDGTWACWMCPKEPLRD